MASFPSEQVREPYTRRWKLSGELQRCQPMELLLYVVTNEVLEGRSILVSKPQAQMRNFTDERAILRLPCDARDSQGDRMRTRDEFLPLLVLWPNVDLYFDQLRLQHVGLNRPALMGCTPVEKILKLAQCIGFGFPVRRRVCKVTHQHRGRAGTGRGPN